MSNHHSYPNRHQFPALPARTATDSSKRPRRSRLRFERLEARLCLAAELAGDDPLQAPINWFASYDHVARQALSSLSQVDHLLPDGIAGPIPPAIGEWIIQLTDEAIDDIQKAANIEALLNRGSSRFDLIAGLGAKGQLLVRGVGNSRAAIEAELKDHSSVTRFSLNQMIEGQAIAPNDPEFAGGLLSGLSSVNAPDAWDTSRGSTKTVIGVVDTGIDPTHVDLYLNVWLNQGEIPTSLRSQLTDIDNDKLITFYDLNNASRATAAPYALTGNGFAAGPNRNLVRDLNANGRIDAGDLLNDPAWTDGRDTDLNGFADDLFGVNFRSGSGDPFAPNNPVDVLGHGTHVAGTLGAIGSNATGVVGLNWQTSLMSLRILDDQNRGDTSAAIRAVNYANQMRDRYTLDSQGRVTAGANIKVLNNSWGQPGGYDPSLETAIRESDDRGILFVAAAGNGNVLGQGVDNDRTSFYPASYESPNVIAVAAMDSTDRPAQFSNFGATSVDVFAPGVGIRSTLRGNAYGAATGTSMATPHVAGTAALIWSAYPEASVDEVRQAILSTTSPVATLSGLVATGGKLNAAAAINADVFAPAARLISKQDISVAGGTTTEFTVQYYHRSGIKRTSIGANDISITRQWGSRDVFTATVKPGSISSTATTTNVTYVMTAPGGSWDVLDYGAYQIATSAGKVEANVGSQATEQRVIGEFQVRMNDSSVVYVDRYDDSNEPGTLRSAIATANATPTSSRIIILNAGDYRLTIDPVIDPAYTFVYSTERAGRVIGPSANFNWSNATTGDLDVIGDVSIYGDLPQTTHIRSLVGDRVIKVQSGATLSLNRLSIEDGAAPKPQPGGGILSSGTLNLDQVHVRGNTASGTNSGDGGGIAILGGTANVVRSVIAENRARASAGILFGGNSTGTVSQSTIDSNVASNQAGEVTFGGGVGSYSTGDVNIVNSTISRNTGVAIHAGVVEGPDSIGDNGRGFFTYRTSTSRDGRFTVFNSSVSNLKLGDNNQTSDVFLYDRINGSFQQLTSGNGPSFAPVISADGSTIVFASDASNLIAGDTNGYTDVFAITRTTGAVRLVSSTSAGALLNGTSGAPVVSSNGRFVAFETVATGLAANDNNDYLDNSLQPVRTRDVYRKDLTTGDVKFVSVDSLGNAVIPLSGSAFTETGSSPSISDDGNRVAFASQAELVTVSGFQATSVSHVYVRDIASSTVTLLSDNFDFGVASDSPTISGDGTKVFFSSNVSTFVNGSFANDFYRDIFRYDLSTNQLTEVSAPADGSQINADVVAPSTNVDGSTVSFTSRLSGIRGGLTNEQNVDVVFIKNVNTGVLTAVVGGANDGLPDGHSSLPAVSSDGSYVAFYSLANNLTNGSTTVTRDLFLYSVPNQTLESPTSLATGNVFVLNSTVAFNDNIVTAWGKVTPGNSLFAGNTSTEVISKLGRSLGNNLYDTVTGQFDPLSDQLDTAATQKLGTYTTFENGTSGFPLIRGSSAINAGNVQIAPATDLRGLTRLQPDIGALEALDGDLTGTLFFDRNANGVLDRDEAGIGGMTVFLDRNGNGILDSNELFSTTRFDDPTTPNNEIGQYEFVGVAVGSQAISQLLPDGLQANPSLYQKTTLVGSLPANSPSLGPAITPDGRFIAFDSTTSVLVPGGSVEQLDVYLYDNRLTAPGMVSFGDTGRLQVINSVFPSISDDASKIVYEDDGSVVLATIANSTVSSRQGIGVSGLSGTTSPMINGDGTLIVFASSSAFATSDNNNLTDIYLYSLASRENTLISRSVAGPVGTGVSYKPKISKDGRYISFISTASNLVANDTNGTADAFVFDRQSGVLERVSVSTQNVQANREILEASVSDDGRYVAFTSQASSLIAGDVAGTVTTAFLRDRILGTTRRIATGLDGSLPSGDIIKLQISGDGGHVVFASAANNLVAEDTNEASDVFVFDVASSLTTRISVDEFGRQLSTASSYPGITRTGKFVSFRTADNAVVLTYNPLEPSIIRRAVSAGARIATNIPVYSAPGDISGRAFVDSVEDGVFNSGETALAGWTVFIDTNKDGRLNPDERSSAVITDARGNYQFTRLPSLADYSIAIDKPASWTVVAPDASSQFRWDVSLQPAATVNGRDFALRRSVTTGQSTNSSISGRLFDDRNGNGFYDPNVDAPLVNTQVYLDSYNFGVRDFDEPRVVTNSQGIYTMSGLGTQNVAIATTLDATMSQTSPLGSSFDIKKIPVFSTTKPFADAQAIAQGDFNRDGFDDVAVVFGAGNLLSIRLNDKLGSFLPQAIDIDLGGTGIGPTSLVVGQFDSDDRLDVAITASYSKNVVILRNFDPATSQFVTRSDVAVGVFPVDIAIGQFGGDAKPDLVVLNQLNAVSPGNSTVQVLINNGLGVFQAAAAVLTGGKNATSLVAGDFIGDANTDIAVVNRDPKTAGTPNGGVSLLRGNGIGSLFATTNYYELGASPIDAVAGDFNGDGRTDIAVTNFKSNSISILKGQTTGGLTVQSAVLGTASGAYDITAGDIDNDGDIDVIASNLKDSNLAIFRNVGVASGDAVFEPLENVGLALFGSVQRMPLVVSNFNRDTSGPGGSGTLDIVTIPQSTSIPTLQLLSNTLINGARRVALTGLNQVTGLDFIVKPKLLPPTFNDIASPLPILEDAAQQSIRFSGIKKGRSTSPSLQFSVTSYNTALISNARVVYTANAASATLVYKPNAHANGTAVLTVRATETGVDGVFGTADDAIFERSVTVTVLAVNDVPKFTVPLQSTVTQKQGAVTIPGFATNLSRGGGADEAAQVLSAFVVSNDANYFAVAPKISATGVLTFTPKTTNSGLVPITIRLSDSGGVANGGINSTTQTVFINILPINDRPSINLLGNQTVVAGSAAQTVAGFANGFLPGGGIDEQSQTIAGFVISTNRPDLFKSLPAIDNNGVLRYQAVADRSGIATVSVQVRDNGGTANGGLDLSAVKTFRITVQPNPDKTAPIPVLSTSSTIPATQLNFTVTVTFGEPINGLTLTSFKITGGTASQLKTVDAATGKYSIVVTRPTIGRVTVQLPVAIARDLAGNSSLQSSLLTVL